jgi:hypothetical protein
MGLDAPAPTSSQRPPATVANAQPIAPVSYRSAITDAQMQADLWRDSFEELGSSDIEAWDQTPSESGRPGATGRPQNQDAGIQAAVMRQNVAVPQDSVPEQESEPGRDEQRQGDHAFVADHGSEQTRDVDPYTHERLQSINLEFERLLELPPHLLARVLSTAGTRNVLVALAGARPSLTKRLYHMLHAADARALEQRIQQVPTPRQDAIQHAQQQLIRIANSVLRKLSDSAEHSRRAA